MPCLRSAVWNLGGDTGEPQLPVDCGIAFAVHSLDAPFVAQDLGFVVRNMDNLAMGRAAQANNQRPAREVGVLRAIGATQGQILTQFLMEAVVLSLLGGLIGLLLGELASFGLARLGGWDFFINPGTVTLALGFSAAVGIVFGVWPARTAAKLQPVEALRFE